MNRPLLIGMAWWVILLAMIGFPACGQDGGDGSRDWVYPDPEWAVESPEAHDLDSTLLQEVADFARTQASNCLLITRDGVIVGEWYWNGWEETSDQNVFSVTKSFTSALVGIAQDRGELDITESASEYISDWVGTPSEDVTIKNLISNDSGRHWDLITDYLRMFALAYDKTAFAIALDQQYEPGTVWKYNNSAIQTLERVLEEATGVDVGDYAEQHLFEPLGMDSSYGRDSAGNPVMCANLSASCRDLARFGYLYLRGGRWSNDRQIITRAWVEESTQPSTPLNSAYGYMWWLNRDGHWVAPSAPDHVEGDGKQLSGLPENVFRASGAFNQIIFVDPNTDIVFTRIGWVNRAGDTPSSELVEELAKGIRDARRD